MFLLQFPRLPLLLLLLPLSCDACPSGCHCYSLTVECGSLGLREIPQRVPDTTQTVFLQDNAIVHIRRLDLSGLGRLLHLYLQNNSISALEPGAFLAQGPLLELALNGNLIHLLTPDTFTGLDHLRILYLAANQITRLHDHTFTGLQSLQELHLQENSIEVLGDQALSGLSSLALLDLSRNQLHTLGPASIRPLVSLQVLRVTENPWRCDCALHWLRSWIDAEGQRFLSWSTHTCTHTHTEKYKHTHPSTHTHTHTHLYTFVHMSSMLVLIPQVCIPPVLHLEPSQLTVQLGESLRVACQASGFPRPLVTWRKISQGRALLGPRGQLQELGGDGDTRRQERGEEGVKRRGGRGGGVARDVRGPMGVLTEEEVEGGEMESFDPDTGSGMLFLSNVTVAHAGLYVCEALNPGGVAHMTFHLAINTTSSTALWPRLHSSSSSLYLGEEVGVSQELLYDMGSMDFSALGPAAQTVIAASISLLVLIVLLLVLLIYSRQQQHKQPFCSSSRSSSKEERILYVNNYSDGPTTFSQLEEYRDDAGQMTSIHNCSCPGPALPTHAGLLANQQAALVLQEVIHAQVRKVKNLLHCAPPKKIL
eukprot:XP_014042966.1 PREDICTED: leucine-rich repeat-containing protein 24-like [Salmo salar]